MKNILLLVHDDAGQEARVQAALDITRAVDGHLQCIDVAVAPQAIDTPYDGIGVALILENERVAESENKARLQDRLKLEDVSWSWTDVVGDFEHALKRASNLADLIVINRALSSTAFPDMRATVTALLLHARRPVVAVPEETRGFDAFGHALVAWNGSGPAATAMIAAVPLLRHATGVTLLQIGDEALDSSAEEAATYLARHDIVPRIAHADGRDKPVGKALLDAVAAQRPGYVVMGGYGHGPMREALFGGVTKTMLQECPAPLFLAH